MSFILPQREQSINIRGVCFSKLTQLVSQAQVNKGFEKPTPRFGQDRKDSRSTINIQFYII
jgi:hypothetical protein